VIFSSKNEDGVPKWKQVLDGTATVTRRLKPVKIGKVYAVQPNRGKKAMCYIRVISCFRTPDFTCYRFRPEEEAKKEGFMTYEGLINFFAGKNIDIMDTYRIEFEVMK